MIPKVIHYCWFGKNEIPDNIKKCIDSWKKIMPDYEIIKWDETNYDINKCKYIKEAYMKKKWAFVSDYARLDILYNNGGVYLDVDVEVYKSFDSLLKLDAFCGREKGIDKNINYINTGLVMGAKKHCDIIKEFMDDYNNKSFIKEDGSLDLTPCPVIQTRYLEKYGFNYLDVVQEIKGLSIFTTDYFCPMNQYTGKIIKTKNTYSVHKYFGSWYSPVDQNRRNLRIKYSRYGRFLSNVISTFIAYKQGYGIIYMWREIFKKIKK